MRILAAIALALVPLVTAQPVPLPSKPDGFRVGSPTSDVPVCEAFLDLLCPDCAGDFPTLQQVVAHYNNKIAFILHSFPLPYHTFGFRVAQGLHVAASLNKTAQAPWDFAAYFFQNQGDFYGAALNTTWVDGHITTLAAKLGYDSAAFAAGLNDGDINEATRISWKYSTSRYTTGTPHCAFFFFFLHLLACEGLGYPHSCPLFPPTPPASLQTCATASPSTTSCPTGPCLTGRRSLIRCWRARARASPRPSSALPPRTSKCVWL